MSETQVLAAGGAPGLASWPRAFCKDITGGVQADQALWVCTCTELQWPHIHNAASQMLQNCTGLLDASKQVWKHTGYTRASAILHQQDPPNSMTVTPGQAWFLPSSKVMPLSLLLRMQRDSDLLGRMRPDLHLGLPTSGTQHKLSGARHLLQCIAMLELGLLIPTPCAMVLRSWQAQPCTWAALDPGPSCSRPRSACCSALSTTLISLTDVAWQTALLQPGGGGGFHQF